MIPHSALCASGPVCPYTMLSEHRVHLHDRLTLRCTVLFSPMNTWLQLPLPTVMSRGMMWYWCHANIVRCLCPAVPSSPPSTTTRCGSNDSTAPSQSCTSPSCRKANTPSSTRKNTCIQTRTVISAVYIHLLLVYFHILAICTVTHQTTCIQKDISLWRL